MKRRKFIQTSLVGLPLVTLASTSQAGTETGHVTEDVINSGIGGNNSIDLLERIDKDCLSHQPALTILMVGTNDMNSKKYVPIKDFEKNLRSIIDKILKIKSQLLLMNLCAAS
jgi:lysophospholipase L1-like esterase